MKMSRISLLLSVAVFVAPAITIANDVAPDAVVVTTSQEQTATTAATSTSTEQAPAQETLVQSVETKVEAAAEQVANVAANVEEKVSAETKTIMAAITAALVAGRNTVFTGLDKVAYYTFVEAALKKLASFDCLKGGKFENNIPGIQKTIVAAALAGLGYAAYQAYVNQNAEDFDADFDADNN